MTLSFDGPDRTEEAYRPRRTCRFTSPITRRYTGGTSDVSDRQSKYKRILGLSNPERAGSIGRLLAAVDADIAGFQEEYETQDSAIGLTAYAHR